MISNTTSKVTYQGDGKTTEFPYTFDLAAKSDMHVKLYDTETETATELTSDFYVDTTAGKVIYPGYESGQEPEESARPAILKSTQKLTLYRQTEVSQLTALGSKYPLPAIEEMSDKLTMICQEHDEHLSRCLTAEMGSDKGPEQISAELYEYGKKAIASAAAALVSENAAKASATNAANSATNAKTYAADAKAQKEATITKANEAAASAVRAETQATLAKGYAQDLSTAVTNAKNYATQAAASEANAKDYATSANSAANVADSKAELARLWAESAASPDGKTDAKSDTGKTKSSRSWAIAARESAISAATVVKGVEALVEDAVATLRDMLTKSERLYLVQDDVLADQPLIVSFFADTGTTYTVDYVYIGETAPTGAITAFIIES